MFRTTNPIQTPRKTFRIKWDEVAALTAVCTCSVGVTLAVVTVALGASTSPANEVNPPAVVTTPTQDVTDCEDNLKAWTRDASQLIEDMDSRWASSAPYSTSVRADNIEPMTSRLDYVLEEVCK